MQDKMLTACRLLENMPVGASLDALSKKLAMSPSHFQRSFTRWVGLSPKRYAMALRDARVRELLSRGVSVTEAFLEAGYETPSRFYEGILSKLGMLPSQYRAQGNGTQIRVSMGRCSLGEFLVALSEKGVCAIELGGSADVLLQGIQDRFSKATIMPALLEDDALVAQVIGVLEGLQPASFPMDIRGTVFQQQVWKALLDIPKGKTASYAEVAQCIGNPTAHRAVAKACASNTLAVAIPCHRVVRSDGGLSGYRWGVERKQQLLDREKLPG